jgi:hypothetical protein
MGHSKRGGRGKKPPSSSSVTFVDGNPIKSSVVPSPSATLVIDGFPIRAMPHLAADAEVGSPDAPPNPEGHEDSEVPIWAMPHLAADAEVGSPNAPPDPERHKDSEVPIRAMPHLAADAEVKSPDAPPDPEGQEDSEDARGSSLSPSLLQNDTGAPIKNEEEIKDSEEARGFLLYPPLLQFDTDAPIKNGEEHEDTTINNPLIRHLEGVEGLGGDALCHMNAFYAFLKDWYRQIDYMAVLLTKAGYDERVAFGEDLILGVDCRLSYLAGNTNAYKWAKKYHLVTVGQESKVLVLRPSSKQGAKNKGMVDVSLMRVDKLQKPTYVERLFVDLLKIHQEDHCKGNTLLARARDWHGNITHEVCKMFTDVCPHCIKVLSRRKPVARIQNILTDGFGVRRQVDLIDFQSMPDGVFKYLCNVYIDHGVKKMTSIPLSGK